MTDWLFIGLALAAGVGLGVLYFGGLWLTIRRLPETRHPALLTMGSYLARLALTMAGFYFVMDGQLSRLIAALAGFFLARQILVRRWRPGPAPN